MPKKEILINNEIFFPEGLAYEDNYWGTLLHFYINKIYEIAKNAGLTTAGSNAGGVGARLSPEDVLFNRLELISLNFFEIGSGGSGSASKQDARTPDEPNEAGTGSDRRTEGYGSDGLGSADEQHPQSGG